MDFLRKEKERVRASCFESWLDRGPISDGLEAALRDAVDFFNQGRDAKGWFEKVRAREITFHNMIWEQSLLAEASSSAWTPSVTCRPPPQPPPASPSTTRDDTHDSSLHTWDQQ